MSAPPPIVDMVFMSTCPSAAFEPEVRKLACRMACANFGIGTLACAAQTAQQVFDRHALAIVRINESRRDTPVRSDNKGRRNRHHPGIVALVLRKRAADCLQQTLHLLAEPDRQIE